MLSVLARGEHADKAALLFAVPDVQERKLLDRDGINQLAGTTGALARDACIFICVVISLLSDLPTPARSCLFCVRMPDLLCCLFANKALASTSPHPLSGAERDAFLRNNAEQSPLLRSQFRKKLEPLAAGRGTLDWDSWLQLARTDSEILSLMEWDLLDRSKSAVNGQHHRKKTMQYDSTALLSSVDYEGKKHHPRNGHGKARHSSSNGISSSVVSPAAVASPSTHAESKSRRSSSSSPERADEHRRVSLLSKPMKKKFQISRAMMADDGGLRRNPFETQFPAGHAAMSSHSQMHWCQCTIS